jgi:hypothetical protein
LNHFTSVVAGPVPAISHLKAQSENNRRGRDKADHDAERGRVLKLERNLV